MRALLVAATALALVLSFPQMLFNMNVFTPIDYEADYAVYKAAGLVTGTSETDTWTANASWSERCPLGSGAPILWGRPGGNAELLGAPYLSWVHVITDALSLSTFLIFLIRLQRLMLKDDSVINRQMRRRYRPTARAHGSHTGA